MSFFKKKETIKKNNDLKDTEAANNAAVITYLATASRHLARYHSAQVGIWGDNSEDVFDTDESTAALAIQAQSQEWLRPLRLVRIPLQPASREFKAE